MKSWFIVLTLISAVSILAPASGAQIPRTINYQGLLADKDTQEPLAGPVDLTFRLFELPDCDTGDPSTAVWIELHTGVTLDNGLFNVVLGSVTSFPDSLKFDEQYCLGIEVGGEELLPRQPLSSVAYSLNSLRADTALTVLEYPAHDHDDLYYTESELNGSGTINDPANPVDWTKLKNVPADFADGVDNLGAGGLGSVIAGEGLAEETIGDDKILSVAPEGIVETMLADSAVTGEKIRSNSITAAQIAPGAITAGEIASGTITAAEISNNTITSAQISPSTITANEIFGNTLTADQLASASVKSEELADSAVTSDKIMPEAVTTTEIADGTISLGDLGQNGAAAGQVIKWSGSAWTVSDDGEGGIGDITSVTAGPGLAGGGDTLDVVLSALFGGSGAADSIARSDHDHDSDYVNRGEPNSVDSAMIASGSVTGDHILDGSIGAEDIGQNGAGVGQVMKWNGSGWVAADDSVGSGSGISVGWVDDGSTLRLEDPSDSVGIGVSMPTEKLELDGNFRAHGTAVIGPGHSIVPGSNINLTGENHTADGDHLVISGGSHNTATGTYTTVAGGQENSAGDEYASVGGGRRNIASGRYSVVSGGGSDASGDENRAEGDYSVVGGGRHNVAGDSALPREDYEYATVGGGQDNQAVRRYCTVSGGRDNRSNEEYATVGGGMQNVAENRSFVGGGSNNSALDDHSVVSGGMNNTAINGGAVGGGSDNSATGSESAIPGGRENEATGYGSFAAGSQARARHEGSMVFSANWPSTSDDTISTGGADQFVIRAGGGVYITDSNGQALYNPTRLINTSTGAYLGSDGMWHDSSDRALKENFGQVDGDEILEKIAALPVTSWNYKADDTKARHVGPVAQDFHEILGVGSDEKTIAALDEAGISLAAIQKLYMRSKSQESEIDGLKKEIEELKTLVKTLTKKQ